MDKYYLKQNNITYKNEIIYKPEGLKVGQHLYFPMRKP